MESMSVYATMEDLLKARCDRLENELAEAKKSSNEWTKEAPTVNGWYWVKSSDGKKGLQYHSVLIVGGWVHHVLDIEPFSLKCLDGDDVEWKGPLDPDA